MVPPIENYRSLLEQHFGYPGFKEGQQAVLENLMGSDVLAVMPTGSGKSMCYVLPALAMGKTLVVSPLIALMHDQVESLRTAGVPAALINSTVPRSVQNQNYLDFVEGRISLLFVAPERFRNERFMDGLRKAGVNLLAVDEAHCMSEWGHDFRPDYLMLGSARERLGSPRTLALTATADPRVRQDIARGLKLDASASTVVASVDRPNLHLSATAASGPTQSQEWLVGFLKERPGASGIVYVRTRDGVDQIAEHLRDEGLSAAGYHAGMPDQQRAATQRAFMRDEIAVVVATNAFGLGIDKADVRFVIHMNMPGRLEAYYQEAGRAGRDGDPAECVLLFTPRDEMTQQFFIDRAHPHDHEVRDMWRRRCAAAHADEGFGESATEDGYPSAFNAFRLSGLVDDSGTLLSTDPEALIDTASIVAHRRHAEDRLRRMIEYSEGWRCRRRMILSYFGEDAPETCDNCDNCLMGRTTHLEPAQDLMESLLGLRDRLAREYQREAASLLDSRTIRELAIYRPHTRGELVQTRGIAKVKADWFGDEVLECIAEWEQTHPSAPERWPRVSKAPVRRVKDEIPEADRGIYDSLAAWRRERAREDGVPAYVVCSNRTLRDLAATRPADRRGLTSIWGFGASRVERYGDEVLAVIRGMS